MSYTIRRTNGTTLVEVADQTINTSASSVALVGRGAVGYGQAHAENFVKLLENFAHTSAPANPLVGQQWWDSANGIMKVWNGVSWQVSSGSGFGSGGTSSPSNAPAGGTTLGGSTAGTNRAAGSVGIMLVNGSSATTVTLMVSEGRILAIASAETINNAALPASVTIDGQTYTVQARFPNGVLAGLTLAADSASYVFSGTATSARYADVAERYETSETVEPGDVVELGGTKEIQKTQGDATTAVFGVISTNPGYMMNANAGSDETHPYVALAGRVPCKVEGTVAKGDRLVASATPGVARKATAADSAQAILGRALADKTDVDIGLVEVVLGGVR